MKKSILVIVGLMGILILLAFSLLQTQQSLALDQQIKNLEGTKVALVQTVSLLETRAAIDPPPIQVNLRAGYWITVPVSLP